MLVGICVGFSKPLAVNVDSILKYAQIVEHAKISAFSDSTITYHSVFLRTNGSKINRVTDAKIAKLVSYKIAIEDRIFSGGVPKLNERCVIVIDTNGYVRLFGKYDEEDIIFWSPISTGSECILEHSNLFKATQQTSVIDTNKHINRSWANVTIRSETLRLFFEIQVSVCGKILFQNNEILFIPNLADSRAYTLTNTQNFKLKHHQVTCIEGYLKDNVFRIVNAIE